MSPTNATLLYNYILAGHYDCVEKLLKQNGLNPNEKIPDKEVYILHLSVGIQSEDSAFKLAELILKCGADPNLRSDDKLTALHIAAAWGRMNIVKLLLNYGADSYLIDEDYKTAIDYAEENGYFEIVEYISYNQQSPSVQRYTYELDKILINNQILEAEYTSKQNDTFIVSDNDILNKNLPRIYDYSDTTDNVNRLCQLFSNNDESYNSCKQTDSDSYLSCNSNSPTNPNLTMNNSFDVIEFTNTNENQKYDVYLKNTNSFQSPVYNVVIASSQKKYAHINYNSKSSCSPTTTTTNSPKVISTKKLSFDECEQLNERLNTMTISELSEEISFPNFTEEYHYEDKDAGIILEEKRLRSTGRVEDFEKDLDTLSVCSLRSSSVLDYDTDTLKTELKHHGCCPGPITKTTKKVYLKQLRRILKNNTVVPRSLQTTQNIYSVELQKTFGNAAWFDDLSTFISLENVLMKQFDSPDPRKRWREGIIKSSFTYLLLDPRISNNLPCRCNQMNKLDVWKQFIDSIFYVGKGKRSRPYSHLYQAVSLYNNGITRSSDKKIQLIIEIWKDGTGVVCLHIFQNVIPVEAYTREAAMIEALGLKNLKNVKVGNYYGSAAMWPIKQKKLLGVYLLYRAMLIFLNEGERQLRPVDICK